MTCQIFKTNPEFVTPVGIWLARKLNKGVARVWPLVRQKTYDKLSSLYYNKIKELHDSLEYVDELEEQYYSRAERILPFPSGRYEGSIKESLLPDRPYKRFSYRLEPIWGGREIDIGYTDDPNYTDHVKELLVKQIGELWQEKGEAEARRLLFNDDRKIRKIPFY
jgi:hypothetical protein